MKNCKFINELNRLRKSSSDSIDNVEKFDQFKSYMHVGFGIPLVPAYIIAIIGNMLPVPFIYFFARKVLEWGKDKPVIGRFFTFCLEKGEKGGKALQAKAGRGLFVALLLFVGIPLPGTGAWTGTLAASLLDMDFKSSVLAVMLGVILAGLIMGAASAGLFGALFAVFS